jgi:hypothetical protein
MVLTVEITAWLSLLSNKNPESDDSGFLRKKDKYV